ncbi:MAG TPA: hypothetical protein VMZ30_02050 [Pyrinomonadaceae bacterium]|nr:hypothetical protein [Pyrinomonadaceae bacterium]
MNNQDLEVLFENFDYSNFGLSDLGYNQALLMRRDPYSVEGRHHPQTSGIPFGMDIKRGHGISHPAAHFQ